MSFFETKIQKIFITDHPNADKLQLGHIGTPTGWQVVVQKGRYATGDLVAYIGENAVVPDWVLKTYGFWNADKNKGMLAGTEGNRVKAIKLRNEFSMGIVIPTLCFDDWYTFPHCDNQCAHPENLFKEGYDVSHLLGVTKYDPPIPAHLNGEVCNVTKSCTVLYDIESHKNYPNVLRDGEQVYFTEKLHGTQTVIGYWPGLNNSELINGNVLIYSKGLGGGKGLVFKNNERNTDNLYVKSYKSTIDLNGNSIVDRIVELSKVPNEFQLTELDPVYVFGETFGPVQDLTYGYNRPQFRAFDVYIGRPGLGRFLNYAELVSFFHTVNVAQVPVLYEGSFSERVMNEFTTGMETVSGKSQHIREGIVIKPVVERIDPQIGRVILKSVSQEYLLRKNKNATDYQ